MESKRIARNVEAISSIVRRDELESLLKKAAAGMKMLIATGVPVNHAYMTMGRLWCLCGVSPFPQIETLERLVVTYAQVYSAGKAGEAQLKVFQSAGLPFLFHLKRMFYAQPPGVLAKVIRSRGIPRQRVDAVLVYLCAVLEKTTRDACEFPWLSDMLKMMEDGA
jgi:hypothetical protein